MKIGVISDTHDNITNITKAVVLFNYHQVGKVIHCGDFVAPFSLLAFKDLKCSLVGVFGNCDGERDFLLERACELNYSIFQPPYIFEINDKKILISHQPIPYNHQCDVQLYGHTHKAEIIYQTNGIKPSVIVNPGEAGGWLFQQPSIAILDLDTLQTELINL